ncbi:MAG: glycosyltransferase, partial [Bdellovibrionales bacterium]|nr:glycosyltransferase [Bdellovibrionales bacterium]
MQLRIVVLGLSLSSSWGNGHATTFRSLLRALHSRGHRITFLERDCPWYADHRDLCSPSFADLFLYDNIDTLTNTQLDAVREADVVIVGSYVPDGRDIAAWVLDEAQGVTVFYDIDTPITLRSLSEDACDYISHSLLQRFDLYLSFTGGPTLRVLERSYGAKRALPLYCSVDMGLYYPGREQKQRLDLGYLGTYSKDRQSALQELLLEPARRWKDGRFAVYGPQYPADVVWPSNVARRSHLAPPDHRSFYHSQRFTLNLTRADMVAAGFSPSVRLFEAAASGVPIISDYWSGLESFFRPDEEILIARSPEDTLEILRHTSEQRRAEIAERALKRVLAEHTSSKRAEQFEQYYLATVHDAQ